MDIKYRDGLLFTEIHLTYDGKSKLIDNIVVDTGASRTLISQEIVDDIGIKVNREDEIITSYGIGGKEHAFIKEVDKLVVGNYQLNNFKLDFMLLEYEDINGLLGLDILMEAGFIINLSKLKLER